MASLTLAAQCTTVTASLQRLHGGRKATECSHNRAMSLACKDEVPLVAPRATSKPRLLVVDGDRMGRTIAAGAMAAVLLALSPIDPSAALAADIPGASEEVQELAERNMDPTLVASLENRAQIVESKKDKGYTAILFPTIILATFGTIFVTAGGLSTLFQSSRK